MLKYKLDPTDTKSVNGVTVTRIVALSDFGDVKVGDRGGYIQKEANLSHEGDCWVYEESCVFENASVSDNAKVFSIDMVYGNRRVYGDEVFCGTSIFKDELKNQKTPSYDDLVLLVEKQKKKIKKLKAAIKLISETK